MDPNANLAEQADLIREINQYAGNRQHPACINAQHDLAELRQALYDWIRDGGFEPDWAQHPIASAHYGKDGGN